jgi:hypothetical protein
MNIGGRSLQDHLRLLAPLFVLITAVFILRLVLALAGAPGGIVRALSVGVAGAVSVLAAAFLIHFKRFGGYTNLVASVFMLGFWEQLLIVVAIGFATLTRTNNIYVAPEYSGRLTPLQHILGHLTFGLGLETLMGAAMACLVLWLLRKLVPLTPEKSPS